MAAMQDLHPDSFPAKKRIPFTAVVSLVILIFAIFLWALAKNTKSIGSLKRDIASLERAAGTEQAVARELFVSDIKNFLRASSELPQRFAFTKVIFLSGTTDMKAGADQEFEELAQLMIQYPGTAVTIEAFVEETHDEEENLLLSENRAMLVREELIGRGIEPSRIHVEGKGPKQRGPQVYVFLKLIK